MTLVSICIPSYNNAKYIDDCIKSALNQTYKNIEIILVDDHSTDSSLDIAKKYQDKIKLYYNVKNLGQPKNTNKCVELSHGKYVVILHNDDQLLPNMVEKLVAILEANPNVGIVAGERILTDENNKLTKIAPFYNTDCVIPGIKQARIFMMTSFLPCQIMFRRDVFNKIDGVNERHISNLDGLLWFKCCLVSDLAYIQDEVCIYRYHPEQTTARYNKTINHMMEYYITLLEMFRLSKGIKYLEDFFETATKRVAELTLRFSIDAIKSKDYELVKRYLILAQVFDLDIIHSEKYRKIKNHVVNDSNIRDFSYPPPKGSIKLNLLNKIKEKNVIIYGAGKVGKTIYRSLKRQGIEAQFWDIYADTIKIEGAVITKPSVPPENCIILMAIFSEEVCKEIASTLDCEVIYERETIIEIISYDCSYDLNSCHMCPIDKDKCDMFVENFTNEKQLIIPTLGVLVSNKCNLSCKGCNHLRYLYEKKDNISSSAPEIIINLKKIINVSDLICRVVIVGGEAFLHPQIHEILKQIKELPKIGYIHVITNGTIMPKEETIRLLADDRIILEISDYGILQDNIEKFTIKLDKYGVNYYRMKNLQWYDFGSFEKRERHDPYKTCCFISNDLFNGKLHKCSRSGFGTLLGQIPDYKDDYIDIRNDDDLLFSLSKFLKNEDPEVCQHCNGTSVKIKVGEQK